ncbi:MAG: hypothetical protein QF583_05175, partial [Rhodospirillales bacterium]|nr:hypothetical protein [Rhodospirillales bacterium]
MAVAKRRAAPFTAVSDSGLLNKGRTLFPEFLDEHEISSPDSETSRLAAGIAEISHFGFPAVEEFD